ncbi:MAG: ABC-type phosphate uptake system permease component PstA, partial [Roseibaca calidilacus]
MRTTTSLLTESDRTRRRNAAEKRFRIYGMIAIAIALSILAIMLFTIIRDGSSAFVQAKLTFPVTIDESVVDKTGNRDPAEMARVTTIGYGRVLATSLVEYMDERNIAVEGISDKEIGDMISKDAPGRLRSMVL